MNLASIIDGHDGASIALIEDDRHVSYAELRERVAAMRAHFGSMGLGLGDHVAVACGNEIHFVVATLGALGAGCVVAPINPYSADQ